MAYAKLAGLDVQYGLYTSFLGGLLYWFFGTSKDISIGPVAVLSTVTGKAVLDIAADYPDIPAHVIASGLGVVSGAVVLILGLVRCGWILDIIPHVALSAFVTGSAITIGMTQVPPMLVCVPIQSGRTSSIIANSITFRVYPTFQQDKDHTKSSSVS